MPLYRGSRRLILRRNVPSAAVTPVTINAIGTVSVSGFVTTFNYSGLTIVAGSNIALIVTVMLDSTAAPPTSITATWDSGGSNQAMSLLAASPVVGTAGGSAIVFGLRNPAIGNKTLAIVTDLSDAVYVCAIAFNNVKQTSDAAAFPISGRGISSGNGGTANPTTITIPSSVNDYCVAVTSIPSGNGRSTQSDTELYFSTAGATNNAEAQYGVGAASKIMTVTLTASSGNWLMAAVDVAAGP